MWFLGRLILISVEEENTGPRQSRCVTSLGHAEDALGQSGSNLEAVFEGATQEREGGFRNMGAGRCDLKIVTPYSSSPRREETGTKERQKRREEEAIQHSWIGWRS